MRVRNGVDIVAVERIKKSMKRPGFMARCFSPEEQEYICRKACPAETAAALWAAKEAFGKALGEGLAGFAWPEVQVLHLSSGAPYLYFEGAAAERMRREGLRAHLSLTHEGGFATAFVVLEKLQDTPEVHFV